MIKIKLPAITLVAVAGNKQAETIVALYKSMKECVFAEVILITNVDLQAEGIKCINVGGLKTWQDYNYFIIKELYKYFTSLHCLIVQHDSWVLDGNLWDDKFLDFDYIGARGLSDGRNNFNGGYSLRSLYFQETVAKDNFIDITSPEDEVLCRLYRAYLEKKYGIKYCTDEIADKFSFELHEPVMPTFGFHNFHWKPYVEHIIIRRSHAMGDIIMMEPLIDYFSKKGYTVVLDVPFGEMRLFMQYPHPIKHISQLNPKIVPYKDIDLNMTYEINPKRLVLASYYEMAGITDGEYRNSKLFLAQTTEQKIFKKYILIHIDNTNMPYRNSYTANWDFVVKYYERLGYLVFQVGNKPLQQIAPHYNCPTKDMLMYMCKGADLVIGIDSGICQIAVSLGTPCAILVGSVNLRYRYVDFEKIAVIQGDCPDINYKNCYHNDISTTGVPCVFDKELPPCACHNEWQIIHKSNKLLGL